MAFTMYAADGSPTEYDDRASYAFNSAGLLVVTTGEGTRLTFSPHAWHHLEDTPRGGVPGFR